MFFNSDKLVISAHEYSDQNFSLSDSLFIGGVRDSSRLSKKFKVTKGLKGAIQKVPFISKHSLALKMTI